MADRHADRRRRLLERLEGIGTVALAPGASLRYLTGLTMHQSERPTVLFLQPGTPPAVLLPALETGRVRETLPEADFYVYGDATDPAAAARDALEAFAADRGLTAPVGTEFRSTRLLEYGVLAERVAWEEVRDIEPAIAALRGRKDDAETERLRRAAAVIDDVLAATVETIEPGRTEREIARSIRRRVLDSPAEGMGPLIVASGPNTANPHTDTGTREIEHGDPVMIDAGVVYEGYYSDITRTYAVGTADEAFREVYDVVRRAARAGREAVAEGVALEAVDRAARDVIEAAGYGDAFPHRLGHGLGLEGHEPPYLVAGNDAPLEVGHAFTVEPGVYREGLGGVRIEDDVVLTPDGPESLTTHPRSLRVL